MTYMARKNIIKSNKICCRSRDVFAAIVKKESI